MGLKMEIVMELQINIVEIPNLKIKLNQLKSTLKSIVRFLLDPG